MSKPLAFRPLGRKKIARLRNKNSVACAAEYARMGYPKFVTGDQQIRMVQVGINLDGTPALRPFPITGTIYRGRANDQWLKGRYSRLVQGKTPLCPQAREASNTFKVVRV